MERKKLILIDLDGTMYDFKIHDNKIIKEMFGRYILVMFLDRVLWYVNNLDLISNKFYIFKIRIFIYSVLSFSSFKENISKYAKKYQEYVKGDFFNNYTKYIKKLNKDDVRVVFVTNNPITKYLEKCFNVKVIVFKSNNKSIPLLLKDNDIVLVIGNNFSDDILTSYKVNGYYQKMLTDKKTKSIYVGKSKIVKFLTQNKTYHIDDISMLDTILKTKD